jgi:hypothetical protein
LEEPPIQFPLRPESPIQNLDSNTSSSHVGDEGNDIEVGMNDFLWDTRAMYGMLLDAFQQNELGHYASVIDIFYESLKSASTNPLFGPIREFARST